MYFYFIFLKWGEDTLALTENDREAFGDLSLGVFQEDALPMNSAVALSLVSKYVVQYPFTELKPSKNYFCFRICTLNPFTCEEASVAENFSNFQLIL